MLCKSDAMLCDCYRVKARLLIMKDRYNDAEEAARKAYKISVHGQKDYVTNFCKSVIGVKHLRDNFLTASCEEKAQTLEKLADGLVAAAFDKKAIKTYEEITKIIPTASCAAIYFSIAETCVDDKQYEKAIEFFDKEMELNKNIPKEQVKTMLRKAYAFQKLQLNDKSEETRLKAKSMIDMINEPTVKYELLKDLKFFMGQYDHPDLDDLVHEIKIVEQLFDLPQSQEKMEIAPKPWMFSDVVISEPSDDESNLSISSSRAKRFKRNEKGETQLHLACIKGNLQQVKMLIEKSHPLDEGDYLGWTPLHEACNHNHPEIVEYLLEKGANVDAKCKTITPLHDTLSVKTFNINFDIVEMLIEHGATALGFDEAGKTPLDLLNTWKENNKDLTPEDLLQYNKFEKIFRDKLVESGLEPNTMPENKKRKQNENANFDSDESNDIVMDDEELALQKISEDDNLPYRFVDDDLQTDWHDPKVAKHEYKLAMSNLKKRPKPNPDQGTSFEQIPSLVLEEDLIFDDCIIEDVKPTGTKPKRMRQTKLNCSIQVPRQSSKSKRKSNTLRERNYTHSAEDCIVFEKFSDSVNITDEVRPTKSSKQQTVKVRIKDRVIVIPIQDFEETFQWLSDAVVERYNAQTGMRPNVSLQRLDGAMFSVTDSIGTMLENGSEIVGIIQSWNQPPIQDRYNQNCANNNLKPLQEINELLKIANESTKLMLEDISSDCQIGPILSTVRYEFSLKSLLLSDVDFSIDKHLKLLSECLSTLPNLIELKLFCCGLNASFFNQLQAILDDNLNLKEIQLDYNNFSNILNFTLDVAKFLSKVKKIEVLSLRYCNLPANLFKNQQIKTSFSNLNSLRSLSVAGNLIGLDGVKEYLNIIPVSNFSCVDFSNTQTNEGLGIILKNNFKEINHTVEILSLRSCCLNVNDVDMLAECLQSMSQLQELNLSYNSEIDLQSISKLLKYCKEAHIPLLTLNLLGCFEVTEDNLTLFRSLIELKLLRNIVISCFSPAVEYNLKVLWKDIWLDKAVSKCSQLGVLTFVS